MSHRGWDTESEDTGVGEYFALLSVQAKLRPKFDLN